MPDVGDEAPDFVLQSTRGDIRLSDLTTVSKVLLVFYYEDATPICTSEIAMFKEDYAVVEDLGAVVVAISADNIASHHAFIERLGGVPFPLASDERLEAARAFGVVDEIGKRSQRAVFVIAQGGRTTHAERWFQPGNPSQYEAIFRALGLEG